MSNVTIRAVVGTLELLVFLLLICLSVALAMAQAHRKPAAKKLAHVTLSMRIVGLSALVLGSVLVPSGNASSGAASVAIGIALLIGASVAWRLWQDARADASAH